MKWEEFLNDPKIKSIVKQNPAQPIGDYLYKKMLHDMLECLNGYKDFTKLAHSTGNIPHNVQQWVSKWSPSIEAWITKLTDISQNYYGEKVISNDIDWPALLNKLASIPSEIALQHREAQELIVPSDKPLEDLIKGAIESIARLSLICDYIEKQDYMSFWMLNNEYIDT